MNRKRRKSFFIRIKNSWRKELKINKIIEITTLFPHHPHNPKHALNKIIMDFRNREEIVKFGVIKIK